MVLCDPDRVIITCLMHSTLLSDVFLDHANQHAVSSLCPA